MKKTGALKNSFFSLVTVAVSVFSTAYLALGSDDVVRLQSHKTSSHVSINEEQISQAFSRSQSVLEHFDVPAEADPQDLLDHYELSQSLAGVEELSSFIDPTGSFKLFSDQTSGELQVFQDRQSKKVPDFHLQLREDDPQAELSSRKMSGPHPLKGVKILLDPGHMGTGVWDQRTGRYVTDHQGHQLSESVLNLETALLLESKLEALGAEVMLTHRKLEPVTSQGYEAIDMKKEGLEELRDESLTDWFTDLIASTSSSASNGSDLFSSFEKSKEFNELFSEENRILYFTKIDLQAREELINNFKPDLAVMIHYDSTSPASDPNGLDPSPAGKLDSTKVYIPGAFEPSEMATRHDRAQLALHLADQKDWNDSRLLAHSILTSMESGLHLPPDPGSGGYIKEIEPGLFARDLYQLKEHSNTAIAYVECLFYNDRGEFTALLDGTHPMSIDGVSYPYSDRLALVAESLKTGIVKFLGQDH